jgi:amidase
MLTGYGNIATAVAAVKAGVIDYLSKPADADDVARALLAAKDAAPVPPGKSDERRPGALGAYPAGLRDVRSQRVGDRPAAEHAPPDVAADPGEAGAAVAEGAEPGDLLVVKLEKVETNRATAFTSSLLAPYATDPAAIAARVDREPRRVIFDLDKARGVARLQDTTIQAGGVELPLKPMLGCIGVAPAGKEAIRAGTPGAWGGNMDYASMGAGMTLMLPVNEPGALLLLGDGHARQGQGEVVGTGLETSMDVTFTVQLIKKTKNAWPHAENARDIMVLASARPLIEAFQHATAEMQTWLMRDYGYSERGAQILMGQAAEYEVANVVDANFTVVAKMSKALLKKTP